MRRSWILVLLLLPACPSVVEKHSDTLRPRASFDLRCSEDQLKIVELDSNVAGVDGCGQRATYIYRHGWVMNSAPADQAPPAQPPAGTPPPAAQPPPPAQPPR